MVFYIEHIVFTFRNTHSVYRRHINWIACFYPVSQGGRREGGREGRRDGGKEGGKVEEGRQTGR